MDATSFELTVTMAADPRYTEAMRDLAVHAARYAGCRGADADIYGTVVEDIVRECFGQMRGGHEVQVIVRRVSGPVEFLIALDCERVPGPTLDPHVSVSRVSVGGRRMCCVARRMPAET